LLRKVIEYMRSQEQIPVIDLTLDIVSTSMYYSYIRDERNLSKDKVQALKERLGADLLTDEERQEYKDEIDEFIRKFIELDFEFQEFKESVEYLYDYEKQMLFEEEVVIDYLIAVLWGRSVFEVNQKFEELVTLLGYLKKYMNKFQEICYYDCLLTYHYYTNHDKALETLEILRGKTEGFEDNRMSTIYYSMGLKYYNLKKLLLSDYYLEKALDMYRRMDNVKGILKTKNSLIFVYLTLKKYNTAIGMCEANIKLAKLINNKLELRIAYTTLFNCYFKLNDKEKAKKVYREAKQTLFDDKGGFASFSVFSSWITSMDHFDMNDEIMEVINYVRSNVVGFEKNALLKEIIQYYDFEETNEKLIHLETVLLPIIRSRESYGWDKFVYNKIIKFLKIQGKYKKASEYFNRLLEITEENQN